MSRKSTGAWVNLYSREGRGIEANGRGLTSATGIFRQPTGGNYYPSTTSCQERSQFPQDIRLIREEYEVVRTPKVNHTRTTCGTFHPVYSYSGHANILPVNRFHDG